MRDRHARRVRFSVSYEQLPLENEIRQALNSFGITLASTGNNQLWMMLPRECGNLRSRLLEKNSEEHKGRSLLNGNSFWELSPSYRFDLLGYEIPLIADQLAYAIGMASIYLPHLRQDVSTLHTRPTIADFLFWFNIDSGIRIASSCWERLGLLLDLAFDLKLGNRCSFPATLDRLAKHKVAKSKQYRQLDRIRRGDFQELEAGHGRGARHETTHYISPRVRFFHAELLEQFVSENSDSIELRGAEYWLNLLVRQHRLFIEGATVAIRMVAD